MRLFFLMFVFFVWVLHSSCKKEKSEPTDTLHPVTLNYPSYFPELADPEIPLTEEAIALGRRLYYDPVLSNTGQSCASCHLQNQGFSEYSSNSLPHVNLAWNRYYLWNGKIQGSLEDAMRFEVFQFFNTDVSKLQNESNYPLLFERVFGTPDIQLNHVAQALAQFVRTLISQNSRLDHYLRQELMLSDAELRGLYIFNTERGDCFHCHTLGMFTDGLFHNNGLDSNFTQGNIGRYSVTGLIQDQGKFKTPTLRNVRQTAPYMHDGRYKTLEEVIEFYNSGVRQSATLDPIMTKSSFENGLGLSSQEKADLLAFLYALSDSTFLNQPAFSSP
ncbi:MAG: hypothetical protein JNM44_07210 [Chitinophagaceae bacterium]|nr:hypothetical protein [Chitinophagaceae bacterium]